MKTPSIVALSCGCIGLTALLLLAIGAPSSRVVPSPAAPAAPAPSSLSAHGFSLTSTSVDLPIDEALYPDGPHADVVNAQCTACHSASMVLNQPPLSAEQWTAVVAKMRDVYKAPVAEADMPAIIAYLTGMRASAPGDAKGKTQTIDPQSAATPD